MFQVHLKAAGRTQDARQHLARSVSRASVHNQHAGGVGHGCGVDDGVRRVASVP